VGSLKLHIQENDLVNHFKCFGSIIKAEIIRNWNTNGQSRGFGFVTFNYPSAVDRVLSKI
jgi:RNA recognition motif-containing protein